MEGAPATLLRRPPAGSVLLLVVGVLGTSTAAPLIKAAAASSLAIAFWRMAIASGVVVPFGVVRRTGAPISLGEPVAVGGGRGPPGRPLRLFIPAVSLTTVASAVALVAMQPAWAA